MAAGVVDPVRDLCEEATCSVCLGYFQDPVTTECGHNFCRACLTQWWSGPRGNDVPSCPQCRVTLDHRLVIPNRPLANFVAITQKFSLQGSKGAAEEEEEKEGGRGNGGGCEEHGEPLKLFCQDDKIPICVVCDRSKEHRDHQVVPLEEAARDYQGQIHNWLKDLKSERDKILASKYVTENQCQDLLTKTEAEKEKAVAKLRQLHQVLEEQEKLLVAQAEEVEKFIVRRRDEHFAKVSKKVSSLGNLIQNMEEKCQQTSDKLLLDVRKTLQTIEMREKFEHPGGLLAEPKQIISEVSDVNTFLANIIKQFKDFFMVRKTIGKDIGSSEELSVEDPIIWTPLKVQTMGEDADVPGNQLQRANITLDPDTAFPRLILSADCKSVIWGRKYQDLSDNPERFHLCPFVLGSEGFSAGRHFWEIIVGSEEQWAIGVARKSVKRKSPLNISPEEGIWAVGKSEGKYKAYNAPHYTPLSLKGDLKRIRVCLDYDEGCVSFDDGHTGAHLCKFSGALFSGESVYPFFRVFLDAYLRISP